MISRTEGTTTTNHTYDFEDRLTKAGETSYSYDVFGNQLSKTGTSTQLYGYVGNATSLAPGSRTFTRGASY